MALLRKKSTTTRLIAKHQAQSSREGGLFLSNKDRIKLSVASVENTRLANRQANKEKAKKGKSVALHKRKDGGMVKPKKAKGKRRRITTINEPGGPHTPGAKKKSKKKKKKKK